MNSLCERTGNRFTVNRELIPLFGPEQGGGVLAQRVPRADLKPDDNLPDDTRLWEALQHVGGGTWGGCVYDVEAIVERLDNGRTP